MSDPTSKKNPSNLQPLPQEEKRGAQRTPWRETVTMELENGSVLLGVTRDISLNGAFVETALPSSGLKEGDRGVLAVAAMDEIIAIFCQVSRITNDGVGLLLLDGTDDALSCTLPTFSISNEMCMRITPPQGLDFDQSLP